MLCTQPVETQAIPKNRPRKLRLHFGGVNSRALESRLSKFSSAIFQNVCAVHTVIMRENRTRCVVATRFEMADLQGFRRKARVVLRLLKECTVRSGYEQRIGKTSSGIQSQAIPFAFQTHSNCVSSNFQLMGKGLIACFCAVALVCMEAPGAISQLHESGLGPGVRSALGDVWDLSRITITFTDDVVGAFDPFTITSRTTITRLTPSM